MAYAMGKIEVLVGMQIDGDNEEVVLEQANYKFSPDLNIGYELYRIDYKGERHKVDICEILCAGILDKFEE